MVPQGPRGTSFACGFPWASSMFLIVLATFSNKKINALKRSPIWRENVEFQLFRVPFHGARENGAFISSKPFLSRSLCTWGILGYYLGLRILRNGQGLFPGVTHWAWKSHNHIKILSGPSVSAEGTRPSNPSVRPMASTSSSRGSELFFELLWILTWIGSAEDRNDNYEHCCFYFVSRNCFRVFEILDILW